MQTISNFLGRFIGLISTVFMGVGFIMLVKTIRKSNRVRFSSLVLSMLFSILMLFFNIFVLSSVPTQWWFVFILLFGAGFGFAWGSTTKLSLQEAQVIGKRSVLYIFFWLGSLAITQVLALVARANAVAFGMAGMFFSTGASLGTNGNLLFRSHKLRTDPRPQVELEKGVAAGHIDGQTVPVTQRSVIHKKRGLGKILLGLSAGGIVLVAGGYFLLRSFLTQQDATINLSVGDSQISLSAPKEEPNAGIPKNDGETEKEKPAIKEAPLSPTDAQAPSSDVERQKEVAAIPENALLFVDFEGFSGNAFPLFSEEYMRFNQAEGLGIIESSNTAALLPIIFPEVEVRDFIAEFDFMMPEAYADSHCGILFRSDSEFSDGLDAYYALFLYPATNTANMAIWIDGGWNHSPSVIPNPAFKTGFEYNHIRLEVRGESMKVYLNGEFLSGFDEGTLGDQGLLGLFLFPSTAVMEGNIDYVLFDNLIVTHNE